MIAGSQLTASGIQLSASLFREEPAFNKLKLWLDILTVRLLWSTSITWRESLWGLRNLSNSRRNT
jgi:hypothetical protein